MVEWPQSEDNSTSIAFDSKLAVRRLDRGAAIRLPPENCAMLGGDAALFWHQTDYKSFYI